MADLPAMDSAGYNFGSLASIRKQAAAIAKRVDKQAAELHEEIERTGMIKNEYGEMVPVSSLTEKERSNLEARTLRKFVSPEEIMIGFLATAPNSDDVERSKILAEKATKLQNKMLAGKSLTGAEKSFLRENNFSGLAAMAERMDAEAKALEQKLKGCKSEKDAQRVFTEAKAQLMSESGKKDGSILFLFAALDDAYAKHKKRGASGITMEILA